MVEFLDPWFDRSRYAMGGGSVLVGRWGHRRSTSIDLFLDEHLLPRLHHQAAEISQKLTELSKSADISGLRLRPNGFAFETRFGAVSFYCVRQISRHAFATEIEDSTGIATASTTEILFKKIRDRMVNNSQYLARDLYDVVVASIKDPVSLDDVVHLLAEVERKSLLLDVQKGDARVREFEGILEPTYTYLNVLDPRTNLLDSLDTFNKIAGEVLSRVINRVWCTEFTHDGERFIAYGHVRDLRPLYRLASYGDKSHRRLQGPTRFPSCLNFWHGDYFIVSDDEQLTMSEIIDRYGGADPYL